MKYLSDRMTSASGSIGGTTFGHNRGGLFTRARRIPVNRRTPGQTLIRGILGSLQAAFRSLTFSQQNEWQVFAENVTVRDRLGMAIKLSAQAWFIKFNSPRVQAGLTRVDDGPSIYALADLTVADVEAAITAGGTTFAQTFLNTDQWANETGGFLSIYASRPQNNTKNFFAGPYQLAGTILGATGSPPASPATIVLPFVAGSSSSKIFFRAVAGNADGRTSPPFYFFAQVPGSIGPLVLSAVVVAANTVDWTFNVPVTTSLAPALYLQVSGVGPLSTAQSSANVLTCTYTSASSGFAWAINASDSTLTPPPAFPQSGTVL
jgi:hypothetical protein